MFSEVEENNRKEGKTQTARGANATVAERILVKCVRHTNWECETRKQSPTLRQYQTRGAREFLPNNRIEDQTQSVWDTIVTKCAKCSLNNRREDQEKIQRKDQEKIQRADRKCAKLFILNNRREDRIRSARDTIITIAETIILKVLLTRVKFAERVKEKEREC